MGLVPKAQKITKTPLIPDGYLENRLKHHKMSDPSLPYVKKWEGQKVKNLSDPEVGFLCLKVEDEERNWDVEAVKYCEKRMIRRLEGRKEGGMVVDKERYYVLKLDW